MALDIYVGPLCRLYSRDFTSDFAKFAQQTLGAAPVTVNTKGEVLERIPAKDLLPAILGWRRLITPQFRSAGVTLVDWTETPIGTVKSSQVSWDPYWSLRLLAAYSEFPDLHLPDRSPEDLSQDAALGIIRDHFLRSRFPHLHACDLWLPLRCADPVTVETPTGHTKPVGSVGMLRAELDQIRTRLLAAPDRDALKTIAADPARTALIRGAAATLAIWLPLCDLALEHRLPMALDG
jgi:hypothetical protein